MFRKLYCRRLNSNQVALLQGTELRRLYLACFAQQTTTFKNILSILSKGDIMTIIGFDFTKLNIERKKIIKGKINISNNVSVDEIEEVNLQLGEDKTALKFFFNFTTKYEPEIGEILIEGELVYLVSANEAKELMSQWKKEKRIPKEVMTPILNYVLTKSNIEALILSKEMNLPSPIPLPKVTDQLKNSEEAK